MDSHLVPDMFNMVHIGAFGWPVHDLDSQIFEKSHSGPCLVWRSISLNQHKVIAKGAPCPRQDILSEHPSANLLVHGALSNDWLALAPEVKVAP